MQVNAQLRRGILSLTVAVGIGGTIIWTMARDHIDGGKVPVTQPTVPTTSPTTAHLPASFASTMPTAISANVKADWSAFHGGGELRGEGQSLPAKPLALRWTFKPEEDPGAIETSAAIVGDSVYICDAKGRLYRLGLADGKPKWTYKVDSGFSAAPLVAGGKVYLGDMAGLFHCVSAETGAKLWTYDIENGQPIHAGANILGERIIYGDDGANVVCLTLDGKKAWSFTAGDRVNSTPAVGGGLAYVSGCDAKLRGIEVATGKEVFNIDLPSISPGSPAMIGDRLIIGTDGGAVTCVAADGSKTLWTYEGIKEKAMVYASPAVADGIAVIGARDRLVHAIDVKNGEKVWTFATRGDVDSSPAISDGRVYVGSRDKKLYVLDLKTGKQLGEFQGSRGIEASPAIGQGVVVIGDTSGAVYCLEPR